MVEKGTKEDMGSEGQNIPSGNWSTRNWQSFKSTLFYYNLKNLNYI